MFKSGIAFIVTGILKVMFEKIVTALRSGLTERVCVTDRVNWAPRGDAE